MASRIVGQATGVDCSANAAAQMKTAPFPEPFQHLK
jgi:hypothetical protein